MPDLWTEDGEPNPLWKVPATAEDYSQAATYFVAAVEPSAGAERMQMITRLLKTKEYSRAELLLAMKELPHDPEASHNYGNGFNAADVSRVVEENRRLRRALTHPVSTERKNELIVEHGDEIDDDAFHVCTYDKYDNPMWRYAPNTDGDPQEPTPETEDTLPGAHRERDDERTNTTQELGDILDEAQRKASDPD